MARSTAGAFKNKIFVRKTINGVFLGLIGFIVFAGGAYVNELRSDAASNTAASALIVVENDALSASAVEAADAWEEEADEGLLMLQ